MTGATLELLAAKEKELKELKALVCQLKEQGLAKTSPELATAIRQLQAVNTTVKEYTKELAKGGDSAVERFAVPRDACEDLLKRRFFLSPSFEIYGGVGGLYDLGPPGCAVKQNLLQLWRHIFVIGESLLEVDCASVTPHRVLDVSGHVGKFQDFMVRDEQKQCHRADHLLEDAMDALIAKTADPAKRDEYANVRAQADAFSQEELGAMLKKYEVKAPDGTAISEPFAFNLMFATEIGPTGDKPGFLRPETAQGIFVNFKRLLEFNGGRLPFGGAQIGQAFRNEISPREGLLRVREFTLAEIEYFVREDSKSHSRFGEVKDVELRLFPRDAQIGTKELLITTAGQAVADGVIGNETLAYFLSRTQEFLTAAGIKTDAIRFRQHLANEMAHYASDCWDAEVLTSYGWKEVVGHADRSAFDLDNHSKGSGTSLTVYQQFAEGPRVEEIVEAVPNKGIIGKEFRKEAKAVMQALDDLSDADKLAAEATLDADGAYTLPDGTTKVTRAMVKFAKKTKKVSGETFTPHVIEPSFGIGRIIYCIFEHAFRQREGDEQRTYLSLVPAMAPVKVSILPLFKKEEFQRFVPEIASALRTAGISSKVDESGESIGRRYARTDEIGVPFGITIDHTTAEDNTVTVRERDSTEQIRVPIPDLPGLIGHLVDNFPTAWDESKVKYTVV